MTDTLAERFGHVLAGLLLLFLFDLVFAVGDSLSDVRCLSCSGDFCSSSTKIGVLDDSGNRNFSLEITVECQNCAGRSMLISLNDTVTKKRIKEDKVERDGEKKYTLGFQNLVLSDGIVSVIFELVAVGTAGYETVSSFSCNVFYDDYPEPPSGIRVAPRDSAFLVRWSRHGDRDISFFRVYVGFPDSCSSDLVETSAYEVEITSVGGERVRNGERYCGFVQAVDSGGKLSSTSDVFYVMPARNFRFAEGEDVGCVIVNILGESSLTRFLRRVRDKIAELPGGSVLVRTYYKISSFMIHLYNLISLHFLNLVYHLSRLCDGAYAGGPSDYDNLAYVGAGMTTFDRLGMVGGKSAFELAYGRRIILGDLELGRKILPFAPLFISFRVNPSFLQGRRLIFSESGELIRVPEWHSTMFLVPVGVGLVLFADFLEEQIFVPVLGAYTLGFFFYESYPDGGKFGAVYGPSLSFGGNLLIDFLDRRSEAIAKAEYGIINSYVFFRGTIFYTNLVRVEKLKFRRSVFFDFRALYISVGTSFVF